MIEEHHTATVVVNDMLKRIRAFALIVALAIIAIGVWMFAMGWNTTTAPDWLGDLSFALLGALATLAVVRLVLRHARRQNGGLG